MQTAASVEELFNIEISKSERLRALILIGLLGLEAISLLIIYFFYSAEYLQVFKTRISIYSILIFTAIMIVYESVVHYLLGRRSKFLTANPRFFSYFNSFSEVSLLSILLIIIVEYSNQTFILQAMMSMAAADGEVDEREIATIRTVYEQVSGEVLSVEEINIARGRTRSASFSFADRLSITRDQLADFHETWFKPDNAVELLAQPDIDGTVLADAFIELWAALAATGFGLVLDGATDIKPFLGHVCNNPSVPHQGCGRIVVEG